MSSTQLQLAMQGEFANCSLLVFSLRSSVVVQISHGEEELLKLGEEELLRLGEEELLRLGEEEKL